MAVTISNDALNVGSLLSGSSLRQVDEEFEILPGLEFPLLAKLKKGGAVKFNDAWKFEWIKDEQLPITATLNEALDSTETGIDVATGHGERFQVGQVFKIEDELMLVSSIATDTLTVERDYAGSTAATHDTGLTIYLMSPNSLDTDAFTQTVSGVGEFVFNYPMYTQAKLPQTVMRTIQTNYLSRRQNELDFQIQKHQIYRQRLLERTVLYGKKQQPTASAQGAFDGIFAQLSTNVDSVSGVLDATDIADKLNEIYDFDPTRPITVAGTRRAKRIWNAIWRQYFDFQAEPMTNSVGVTIDRIKLDIGTFDFLICDSIIEDDELLFLNLPDIEVLPAAHELGSGWIEFTRGIKETDKAQTEQGYFWMGTLKVGNEKRHARVHSFTTTLSSYPGAV